MKQFLNMVPGFLVEQSYQISIVFGLVLIACWILRNVSAHWRYLLWLVVIGKCLMPPVVTLYLPLLPEEAGMISRSTFAVTPSPISTEATIEIAKTPSQIAHQTESVAGKSAASESASPDPIRSPQASFRLRECLVAVWLLIVGTLLLQIIGRMWLTQRRLKHTCQPADAETQAAVVALAETLGMKSKPAVRMADSIAQPFVWGWLRGDVYLPKQFAETGTVEQRRAILTHELAHVLRWDAPLNHLQNFVQAVFFFHPLIWWTNQKIRQEREKCCDEIVLSASGTHPKLYCAAIVEMLAQEYASRQSTPSLAVTGSLRNVKERITTMLIPNRRFLRRPSRAAVVTVLFVAACVLPTALVMTPQTGNAVAQDEAAQDEPTKPDTVPDAANSPEETKVTKPAKVSTWPAGQTMDFRVINADTNEPISDVTLELQHIGPGIDFKEVKIQKTDADGWSRIPLPDLPPTFVRVYLVKEGFVSLRAHWAEEPHPTMPKSITIQMEPGQRFGGTVRNEAGEPIPDVTVTIDFRADLKGENPEIGASISTSSKTDTEGRWHVENMPAEIDNEKNVRIYLNHPNYVSDHLRRGYLPIPVTERPPLEELFDQSAVLVMHQGETIEGTVIDPAGKPIPNALIYDNEHYWHDHGKPRASTNSKGEFRITGVEFDPLLIDHREVFNPDRFGAAPNDDTRRGIILTIEAAGYAPELIFANPASSPLEAQLEVGESIHGRVVDEHGVPIAGALVDAMQWRGQHLRVNLKTRSDADGHFRLMGVPIDAVEYRIHKEGYMTVGNFPMRPSPDEYKVILIAPLRIVGSVTDSETGKPIRNFSLIPGFGFDSENGRNTRWIRSESRTIANEGRYEATLNREVSWRFRVEAEGYMPAESRIFRLKGPDQRPERLNPLTRPDSPPGQNPIDKGEISYDFKLTKAAPLTGVVLGLEHKPLANTDVYLATHSMRIENRKVTSTEVTPVKTDSAGRFQFPPEVDPFCIVVVHEQGVGMITEAECETPPAITIRPWESVKDQLQIIRKPSKGQFRDFP